MNAIALVAKAGQIVDEVSRLGPSTSAELALAVAEPRPTVHRIVVALEQLEVMRPTGDGRVELGSAMVRWGDAAVEAFVDRAELRTRLHWVRERLGMSVYFCVRHDDGVLCLDLVDGASVDMRELAPGRILPRHAGAASRALLASDTQEAVDAVLAGSLDRVASGTPVTAEEVRTRLDRTVARGWSVDDNEIVEGVASVAVCVRRSDGTAAGVISVAGLRADVLAQEEAAGRVLTVAAEALAVIMDRPPSIGPRPGAVFHRPGTSTGTRAPALIVKAGALMDALADERIVTSARLADVIDEPVSSVYRMLATLSGLGWVEQIGHRGGYRVGRRVLSLAGEFARRLDIRRAAVPVLQEIHRATGETTFLCIRHGNRAVCIERIDGIRVNSRVLRLGRSLPLHVGAAPRALLAFEDRENWEKYASVELDDVGSRTALVAQLEEIRAHGVALSDNTVTPGIAAIGAPIFDHRGEVAASLSLSGLREGVLADRGDGLSATDLVVRGAAELSRHLGFDVARRSSTGRVTGPATGEPV
ncbi:helix-turn-helix domain-containing protein [Rhodococcus sp. BP-241]|uniref:IclR family transcriptional regulator n=1 Tax=Rhodococcus sp. BP-241 TaxID=2739441 RepID=UPI001C9AEDF3|nr:IclR family transcriptional regulator C-terminal domain-containing protein [Rhodococcus sp. BP-241]MBY6708624.1 helix-turn-helix domain-containing protein [Rhodococcus sp. BP-241]